MNRVGAVLSLERTRIDVPVVTKNQVLVEAGLLFASYEGWDPSHITARLMARESLGSTGLGHGVAIPHARLNGLRLAVAAFLRTNLAIPFDAPDGKPVSEVLVLLVPEQTTQEHLQLLAEAAEMFSDRRFRELLRGQDEAAGVYQAFRDWPAAGA